VVFSGALAVTSTSLKAVVPIDAVTGPVAITNAVGTTTSTAIFKVLPRITSFTPEAELDSTVIVSGTNLKKGATHPVVKVGSVAAVVVDSSPTEVTFTVPPLAVSSKITITTADGTATGAMNLTVMPGFIGI
jgi:hypothetical protein